MAPTCYVLLRFSRLLSVPVAAIAFFLSESAHSVDLAASVVQLRVLARDGTVSFGSAIAIAPQRLATACHVTRDARTIEVLHEGRQWIAQGQTGSPMHDLCLLEASGLRLRPVAVRDTRGLEVGEPVVAAGFLGGGERLIVAPGKVEALYAYDGGRVIRTSAAFDFGSSGGGLFDQAGNLVGILSFKARSGENLRFALPADWLGPDSIVASSFATVEPGSSRLAFWERPKSLQPAFLGAALRETLRRD